MNILQDGFRLEAICSTLDTPKRYSILLSKNADMEYGMQSYEKDYK